MTCFLTLLHYSLSSVIWVSDLSLVLECALTHSLTLTNIQGQILALIWFLCIAPPVSKDQKAASSYQDSHWGMAIWSYSSKYQLLYMCHCQLCAFLWCILVHDQNDILYLRKPPDGITDPQGLLQASRLCNSSSYFQPVVGGFIPCNVTFSYVI